MDRKWWKAEEPEAIGEELIASGLSELHGLDLAHIIYVFTNTEAGQHGCKVAASTRKLPGLMSSLVNGVADTARDMTAVPRVTFVIVFAAEIWDQLDPKERRALVHHELMHIDILDVRIRPHSVEEHNTTVARFGQWTHNLELFAKNLTMGES